MALSTVLIEQMTGQAWVRTQDGRLLPLHAGMRISEDSEIVTEDGATVTVQGEGGTVVVGGGA